MSLMGEFSKMADTVDNMETEVQKYKEIKPETGITEKEAKDFWHNLFNDMESKEASHKEISENELKEILKEYIDDLKDKTDYKDTLPDKFFDVSDLKKLSPE